MQRSMAEKTKVLMLATDWAGNEDLPLKQQLGAVSHYRLRTPASYLQKNGFDVTLMASDYRDHFNEDDIEGSAKKLFSQYDIVITKLIDSPRAASLVSGTCAELGIPLIVDVDDNLFEVPESHKHYDKYKIGGGTREVAAVYLSLADAIFVSTQPLKDYLEDFFKENNAPEKDIFVLPNCLIREEWEGGRAISRESVVSWHGGNFRDDDWEEWGETILDSVEESGSKLLLMRGFTKKFAEMLDKRGMAGKFDFKMGTRSWSGFPKMFRETPYSIGLAFVTDSPFNRCKSHIKWLEHSAKSIPTVVTQGFPYTEPILGVDTAIHGETALIAHDKKSFVDNVVKLSEDKEYAREMGMKARQYVLNNWTIDQHGHKWVEAINKVINK